MPRLVIRVNVDTLKIFSISFVTMDGVKKINVVWNIEK